MMGMLDNLIRPANVMKMFEIHSKLHPQKSFLRGKNYKIYI